LLDEVVVGFAPSVAVLRAANGVAERRSGKAIRVAAILDPCGDLPLAAVELADASTRLERACFTPLLGSAAHRDAVLSAMHDATHIHFACHGRTLADHPLDSHFVLAADEQLSLSDLLSTGTSQGSLPLSNACLVVASACQTALISGKRIPDEVIGLPAGFLQAGVPAFIGTLWPVDDLVSALLMTRFYEIMLPTDKTTDPEPCAALREAMRWLRDLDNTELLNFFGQHRALRRQASGTLALARKYPERQPFKDFMSWAAYSFIGACGVHAKEAPDGRRD